MKKVDFSLLDKLASRLDKGGEPPDDEHMEARVAKLEAAVEYIQRDIGELKVDVRDIRREMARDFRITWGGIIAVALGLAGLLAKGFHWI